MMYFPTPSSLSFKNKSTYVWPLVPGSPSYCAPTLGAALGDDATNSMIVCRVRIRGRERVETGMPVAMFNETRRHFSPTSAGPRALPEAYIAGVVCGFHGHIFVEPVFCSPGLHKNMHGWIPKNMRSCCTPLTGLGSEHVYKEFVSVIPFLSLFVQVILAATCLNCLRQSHSAKMPKRSFHSQQVQISCPITPMAMLEMLGKLLTSNLFLQFYINPMNIGLLTASSREALTNSCQALTTKDAQTAKSDFFLFIFLYLVDDGIRGPLYIVKNMRDVTKIHVTNWAIIASRNANEGGYIPMLSHPQWNCYDLVTPSLRNCVHSPVSNLLSQSQQEQNRMKMEGMKWLENHMQYAYGNYHFDAQSLCRLHSDCAKKIYICKHVEFGWQPGWSILHVNCRQPQKVAVLAAAVERKTYSLVSLQKTARMVSFFLDPQ
ncbi:hypothetical protein VP01_2514g1 [Puccinia sorghi]|uniref:Uncharacterized protein n=1 Tax=Puccinia sorghi TaxID=27349 RepID=A0A0L6V7D8_9BASI|nr:hypothetical protein VP01_2514g1 [Puccinia sorghi]